MRVGITDDMRGIQQFVTLETTDGTVALIGLEDTLAKLTLVHTLLNFAGDVSSANLGFDGFGRQVAERRELSPEQYP